jgi:hypothetical protein
MMQMKFSLQVRVMAVVGSRRSVTAEAQVRSQASACEICIGRIGIGTGTSPSTSVLPCGYQYNSGPYLYSSTCFCYQTGKRAKPGKLRTKLCSLEYRGTMCRRVIVIRCLKWLLHSKWLSMIMVELNSTMQNLIELSLTTDRQTGRQTEM